MTPVHEKKQKLYAYLQDLGGAAVAFSAGVDSTFLLAAAREVLGDSVIAVTGRAVSVPDRELAEAHEFCEKIGAEHVVVDVDQLAVPGFEENPPERCYLCKKVLFSAFMEAAALRGFETVIEGSNADDLNDYRPGMQALKELGIKSPLLEAGLTKNEIRALSKEMGLPTADKPALACLATRIPCGEKITVEKLEMIDEAEQKLFGSRFRQVRVRTLEGEDGLTAKIEVGSEETGRFDDPAFTAQIERGLREIGYAKVLIDPDGYCRGSMNSTL